MALLKEGGADEDDLINCRARYNATSHEYAQFSDAMGLSQQRERVYADGLGTKLMQGKTEGGSGKDSPVKVPAVGAHVVDTVTPDERKELLSRDKIDIHNSSIDKFRESGIIKAEEGLNRKLNPDKIEPMPRKQLRKITKSFSKQGGLVQMNFETDYYLNKRKVEAITYNSKAILLKQKPGRAAVFEELIHTAQYREGKMNGSTLSRIECEIEAQKKLLKYSKAYKLTTKEIEQTRAALKDYEEELKESHRNGGA